MNLKDLKTLADVSRWLSHHVEWSSEASSDMATRAVTIIDDATVEVLPREDLIRDRLYDLWVKAQNLTWPNRQHPAWDAMSNDERETWEYAAREFTK